MGENEWNDIPGWILFCLSNSLQAIGVKGFSFHLIFHILLHQKTLKWFNKGMLAESMAQWLDSMCIGGQIMDFFIFFCEIKFFKLKWFSWYHQNCRCVFPVAFHPFFTPLSYSPLVSEVMSDEIDDIKEEERWEISSNLRKLAFIVVP